MALQVWRDTIRGYQKIAKALLRQPLPANTGREQKHVLILAWEFPPLVSSGVYRPAALARYLAQTGWRVTVICKAPPPQPSDAGNYLAEYVGSSIEYLYVKPTTLTPSYKMFPEIDGGLLNALHTIDLALQRFSTRLPSVVFASGPPFHNFLAAREFGRLTGTRYLLDYRDEWTQCPFPFVQQSRFGRYCEAACLAGAAKVVFTTHSQRTHQLDHFPHLTPANAVVIPNGWEPEDYAMLEPMADKETSLFRLAFVGALGDHTLPASLLSLIETAVALHPALRTTVRLVFAGKKSPTASRQLAAFRYQDMLEVLDQVPKPKALELMQHANALLLINSTVFQRYLPGKLYDYSAIGVPVLVYGAGGEIEQAVRQLGSGIVVPEGRPDQLVDAIETLRRRLPEPPSPSLTTWLQKHTRAALAHDTITLIEEAVA